MKSGLSFLIAARRCEISELEQLTRTSALVSVVGRLVHGLQRERGISNVFLGSGGKRFAEQLHQQIKGCSTLEQDLRASFDALDTEAGQLSNGARLFSRIAFVLHELDALPDLRKQVAALALTPAQATAAFVKLVAGLLAVVFEAADAATNPEISRLLVAMFNFMQGKEFTGQERAFMQLYREEGWYLERTVHYIGRVGLDYVKKKILDDHEGRNALWERLQFTLDGEPDPWFELDKASVDTRQFAKLDAVLGAQGASA